MKVLIVHNKYRQAGGEDQVFKAEAKLLEQFGNQVECLVFNNNGGISPLSLIRNTDSVRKFREVVKSFRPEILHVHNLFLKASPAIINEANKMNIPVVMTLHNYRLNCVNALLLRNGKICEKCVNQKIPFSGVVHSCYRNSRLASLGMATTTNWHRLKGTWQNGVQCYIALTSFGKEKILSSSLNLKASQVEVKPNFLIDPSKGNEKRENKFLFVGRLSEEKGIRTLLEAHQSEEFELEIIGDGPLRGLVEEASQNREKLLFKGKVEHEDIINRMKAVAGVIVPSICYESFGMTVIEAFACGTPVIASEIGALKTLVDHNLNGKLAKPNNPESLLKQILSFPKGDPWVEMSQAARTSYLENYTPEINYRKLSGIYQKVIREY